LRASIPKLLGYTNYNKVHSKWAGYMKHDDKYACPLAAVDQRLDDVHSAWHNAQDAYFDPGRFRFSVQVAIQTLRTVTFVLQNNKKLFADFDAWYGPWQERFRTDKLMRWMVDARNRIEKQGDLEAHSFVRAEIVASHLNEGPIIEVPAELSDAPLKLLKSVPINALGDHVRKNGIMRISRRWVENTLPDYELLEAVAKAYGQISLLVSDAHNVLGLATPTATNQTAAVAYPKEGTDGRMPCMVGHEDQRTLNIWLADGRPFDLSFDTKTIDRTKAHEIEAEYEISAKDIWGDSKKNDEIIASLFQAARTMFLKDGYHIMIAFLLKNGTPVHLIQMAPSEHGEKYLMMRRLAHEVQRQAADAVILTSEIWRAKFDPQNPYRRAVDSSDRNEALISTLVSKTGDPIQYFAEIYRKAGKVDLSETKVLRGGAQFTFGPVYEVWEKAIPDEWLKMPSGGDSSSIKE
jgi:hypothetical protein